MDQTQNTEHSIVTCDLGRRFGDRWAVRNLNLRVEQGEIFGLLGPNGAGKTTTMRMLSCLVAPTEGDAHVLGWSVRTDPMEIRSRVGVLTETPGLYDNQTVYKNLYVFTRLYGLPMELARRQIERYLKELGLWDRREDRTGTFSKGMKQRLSMVRALLHDPDIVILDEPTSALDPESARTVRAFIRTLQCEGKTVLLCTHNLHEAQELCDRVAIIKGTQLMVDTPENLNKTLYRRQLALGVRHGTNPGEVARLLAEVQSLGEIHHSETDSGICIEIDHDANLDDLVPGLIALLSARGVQITRICEIERTLERAYLDLVDRYDLKEGADEHNEHNEHDVQ